MTPRELANRATVTEAAEIVGCNVSSLRNVIWRGAIPTYGKAPGKGGPRIVDLTDVEAWHDSFSRGWYIDSCGARPDEEIARMRGVKVASVRRARERRKRRQA